MDSSHESSSLNTSPDSNTFRAAHFSQPVPGNNGHGCPIPNKRSIVQQIADADSNQFRQGSELNWVRATNGPRSVSLSDSRWAFMDAVITKLRETDQRWGFTCIRGDCNDISTDAIAYWCGQGEPGASTNVVTVDIITGGHAVAWQDHGPETMRNQNSSARWIYPRPGSNTNPESTGNTNSGFNPSTFSWNKVHFINGGVIVNQDISEWSETSRITNFSMSSNGICIDHTMKNVWVSIIHPGYKDQPAEWQGKPWIFIPRDDGKIYAVTYEHLRSKNDPMMRGTGQVCKLGHSENTLAGVISKLVDHAKAIHLGGKPQRDAIAPIQDWYPKPDDILGFAVSTYSGNPKDYRSGSRNERSDIVWVRVPDYNSVDSGGEIVGRTSGSSTTTSATTTTGGNTGNHQVGQCSPEPNTCLSGDYHPHPKDTLTEYLWTCRNRPHKFFNGQREKPCNAPRTAENCGPNPHFELVNGRCLPSCGALASLKNVGKQDHQLQPRQCRTGWTRLGDSKEEAMHGQSVCCKKISSTLPVQQHP